MKNPAITWMVVVLLAAGIGVGCKAKGPTEQEVALQSLQDQLAGVRQSHDQLTKQRADLAAAVTEQATIEAVAEGKRSDEQKARLADLGASIASLTSARDASFEQLQGQMSDFLNVGLNDFPDSAETKACLLIYADEAIVIANDMVTKAGDYKKAVDALTSAKAYYEAVNLPPYQPLVTRIAELESLRFITEERFAQITKGMSKDEVIAIAGVPYYGNIQEDKAKDVESWLYKKADGGAAAVHFRIKTGKVYHLDFEAVKMKVAGE